MSDRGFLFLFSLLMILGGLGAAAWLIMTGQATTVDGLFLFLTALLTVVVFGLYVVYAINRAREAAAEAAKPAAKPATAAAAKPAVTPVAQQ
jgi:TRAP-type C4-dicarboxylate transport system permease small subunit